MPCMNSKSVWVSIEKAHNDQRKIILRKTLKKYFYHVLNSDNVTLTIQTGARKEFGIKSTFNETNWRKLSLLIFELSSWNLNYLSCW